MLVREIEVGIGDENRGLDAGHDVDQSVGRTLVDVVSGLVLRDRAEAPILLVVFDRLLLRHVLVHLDALEGRLFVETRVHRTAEILGKRVHSGVRLVHRMEQRGIGPVDLVASIAVPFGQLGIALPPGYVSPGCVLQASPDHVRPVIGSVQLEEIARKEIESR